MRNLKSLYLLLVFAVLMQACDDNQRAKNYNNKTLVDENGLDFIKTANEAGLAEIKASALAEKISKNQHVVAFAKMMITDHTQAGEELTALADKKLVNKGDVLTVEHKKIIDSLSKLIGSDFDKSYMKMMVNDHEQAVDLFQDASKNKSNAVQKFAIKILPILKIHLNSANAIYLALK